MDDAIIDAAIELETWLQEPGADGLHRWLHFEPPLELLVSTVFTRLNDVASGAADPFDHLDPALAGLIAYMRHDAGRYTGQSSMPWTALGTMLEASEDDVPVFRPILDSWSPGEEVRIRLLIHEALDEEGNDLGPQVTGALIDDGHEVSWCGWGLSELLEGDPTAAMEEQDLHYGSTHLGAYAMSAADSAAEMVSALAAMASMGVMPFDHPPPQGTVKAANVVDALFAEDEGDDAHTTSVVDSSPEEADDSLGWLHHETLGDTPYWIREVATWRLGAELVRRHPARLWPVQNWDCGETYDCLALIDISGRTHGLITMNRFGGACAINPFTPESVGGGDVIRWTAGLSGDPARWVRAVESIAELPAPQSMPESTPMSLAVRVVAGFLSMAFQSRPRWAALHGYQLEPQEFAHLSEAHEWYRANGADNSAVRRMWFLTPLPDGGSSWPEQAHLPPKIAMTQTGIAWAGERRINLVSAYRANGRSLPGLVADIAKGIL